MRAKFGILDPHEQDDALIDDLLALLHAQRVDFTPFFRALSSAVLEDPAAGTIALRRTLPRSTLGPTAGRHDCATQGSGTRRPPPKR